ncbi:neuronal pentraxin-2-like [Oculina patagonica]
MASFNCMLWILRYTFLYLITQVFTKDDLVVKDHLLVGHVFQTVNTDDWLNCIQVCFDEPRCISYNFKTRKSTCQLNDCGLDEMCDRDKSLIYSRGFMFQQIRPTRKDKCRVTPKKRFNDNADQSLRFERYGTSTRVSVQKFPKLEAFTVCFWMKTDDKLNYGTPFKYSTPKQSKELLLYNYQEFQLIIHGENRTSTISGTDGRWHHICATWESVAGSWQLLKNGVVAVAGRDFVTGHVIPGGGVLVLGRYLPAGGVPSDENFIGEMTSFQLWNFVLSGRKINRLLLLCQAGHGNVLTWSDILNVTFSDGVRLVSISSCN